MSQVVPRTGTKVVDPDGQLVGTVSDVFSDQRTLEPQWAVISHGRLRHHRRVVPTSYLHDADGHFLIDMNKDACQHAPEVEPDASLTPDLEQRLQRYYGLSA